MSLSLSKKQKWVVAASIAFAICFGVMPVANAMQTLCATPKVNDAINTAQTPNQNNDPEVQQQYNKEAEQAYKEIVAKQAFVEQYMQKGLHAVDRKSVV